MLAFKQPHHSAEERRRIMEHERFVQILSPSSVNDRFDDALRASARSNKASFEAYEAAFRQALVSTPDMAARFDVMVVDVEGHSLPALKEGSNEYCTRAQKPLRVTDNLAPLFPVDLFLIVPETISVLKPWSARTGLRSALERQGLVLCFNLLDAGLRFRALRPRLDMVKVFETHHSVNTYVEIALEALRHLGIEKFETQIAFREHSSRYDIGSRFRDVQAIGVFPEDTHFLRENLPLEAQNSGIDRTYFNAGAPIKASLLLMGDSHCYSALSQILSCVFETVRFVWATRFDQYGIFNSAIEQWAHEADFVIEELSERFFLANFTEAV